MASKSLDFRLVRYSPVEGTHYFHDPAYPSTIQFLLSGNWESWDVGWVRYKAQDPEIRRMAEEAEARLVQDPESGYQPWPSPPPPGPPPAPDYGRAPPQPSTEYTPSPPVADLIPLSPSPDHNPSAPSPNPVWPLERGSSLSTSDVIPYSSPYGPPFPNSNSVQAPAVITTLAPTVPTNEASSSTNFRQPQQPQDLQHVTPPPGPYIQPAAPVGVVLSRKRETKVMLSIDGDGIRGLSALLLIESLVNAVCVKVGQRLDPHQIFDLTGGNSLGGVIAILLCRLRMQAHRAREAYKQISRQVYLNKRDFFISLHPYSQSLNVDGKALEAEIKRVIQQELGNQDELLLDLSEESGDVFVIATHIEIGANRAALMRSYQTRRITGPELDANMPIWQAMKATSIAPRYVNHRLVIEPGLVDHGTAKNNPVRDILYECRKLFRYSNDMTIIISIGTGIGLDQENEILEMANSIEDRNKEARVCGQRFEVEHEALMGRNWMKYFRFNVPGLEDVPLEEWCHEDLIKEKTSAYLAQPEVGEKFYACVDAIAQLLLGRPGRHQDA
ncbi:FabD/lysophospholipase-like protein [Cucurbitaria berberidis CBS 394.84]|uniref:FabD/lysophospholipase-like protein n=1 Tax=Cucurbitaria berberidis CBS 394.84 TaxID=1168544 RepID=A0A9P4GR57_9PLEO|nr:FabD/lysophospholipase-like protein [Cucurbitaria berberidis CBS 394.84]KAF1851083.1 FabD/lysophospholipase-like protein [Cucurbitaria berberidis CBS 394.84]